MGFYPNSLLAMSENERMSVFDKIDSVTELCNLLHEEMLTVKRENKLLREEINAMKEAHVDGHRKMETISQMQLELESRVNNVVSNDELHRTIQESVGRDDVICEELDSLALKVEDLRKTQMRDLSRVLDEISLIKQNQKSDRKSPVPHESNQGRSSSSNRREPDSPRSACTGPKSNNRPMLSASKNSNSLSAISPSLSVVTPTHFAGTNGHPSTHPSTSTPASSLAMRPSKGRSNSNNNSEREIAHTQNGSPTAQDDRPIVPVIEGHPHVTRWLTSIHQRGPAAVVDILQEPDINPCLLLHILVKYQATFAVTDAIVLACSAYLSTATSRKGIDEGQLNFSITTLCLSGCFNVTSRALLAAAPHWNRLQSLDLSCLAWAVSDELLLQCARYCASLQALNISGCSSLTDVAVTAIAAGSQLRSFSAAACRLLTDSALEALSSQCTMLRMINLSHNPYLSNRGCCLLLAHCPHLSQIVLDRCVRLTDVFLLRAAELKELRALSVAGCPYISDAGCSALSTGACGGMLQSLDFSYCRSLLTPSFKLPHLRHLSLAGCHSLADTAVQAVIRNCPKLTQLNLTHNEKLGPDTTRALAKQSMQMAALSLGLTPPSSSSSSGGGAGGGMGKVTLQGGGRWDPTPPPDLAQTPAGWYPVATGAIAPWPPGNAATPAARIGDAAMRQALQFSGNNKGGAEMEELLLSGHGALTDALLKGLIARPASAAALKVLDVGWCPQISDRGIADVLAGCGGLVALRCSGCPSLSDRALRTGLSSSQPPSSSLSSLSASFNSLTVLHIAQTGITDAGLLDILRHGHVLTSVDVAGTAVSDAGILALASASRTQLLALSVAHCESVSDMSLCSLMSICPSLRRLIVAGCPAVGNATVAAIGVHGTMLDALDISGTQLSELDALRQLGNCHGLRSLDCSRTLTACDELLETMGDYLPQLLDIAVGGSNDRVTDVGVRALVQSFPLLRSLSLESALTLTDVSLSAIALHCPVIQALDISKCNSITDEGVRTLVSGCVHLTSLSLNCNHYITDVAMEYIVQNCPSIESLAVKDTSVTKRLAFSH
jgi:hypothetical protein